MTLFGLSEPVIRLMAFSSIFIIAGGHRTAGAAA
jgi:hypothetical protein